MEITQYQVVLVNLDPKVASEIKKTRHFVVISPDEMNRHLQTVVIAPMTTTSKPYPTRVPVTHEDTAGWIAVDQILTIDKCRIICNTGTLRFSEIQRLKLIIRQTYVE